MPAPPSAPAPLAPAAARGHRARQRRGQRRAPLCRETRRQPAGSASSGGGAGRNSGTAGPPASPQEAPPGPGHGTARAWQTETRGVPPGQVIFRRRTSLLRGTPLIPERHARTGQSRIAPCNPARSPRDRNATQNPATHQPPLRLTPLTSTNPLTLKESRTLQAPCRPVRLPAESTLSSRGRDCGGEPYDRRFCALANVAVQHPDRLRVGEADSDQSRLPAAPRVHVGGSEWARYWQLTIIELRGRLVGKGKIGGE